VQPLSLKFIQVDSLSLVFLQAMLTPENVVIAETGDSWFNCQKLHLPEGCGYEFQMQYGSIGWAVGATLGYAQAAGKGKRVIASIGDGSFQVKTRLCKASTNA
jgi:pyruvate decarboxylase